MPWSRPGSTTEREVELPDEVGRTQVPQLGDPERLADGWRPKGIET